MKRGRPIKPNEIEEMKEIIKKKKIIPEFIFNIFNELIIEEALSISPYETITVLLKDVCKKVNEEHGSDDWPRWWLDVEEKYMLSLIHI